MMKDSNSSDDGNKINLAPKPRQSIKADAILLSGLLREGLAKVVDAGNLGKRLSSEIWISFGAIQLEDNFNSPTIATMVAGDETSPIKICRLFVACSECFSVFKYDGHAYGTTGLVKHVKVCQGAISKSRVARPGCSTPDQKLSKRHHLTEANISKHIRNNQADSQNALRTLAIIVEDLRCEQWNLKQQVQSMINMLAGTSYVSQIQVISTTGEEK